MKQCILVAVIFSLCVVIVPAAEFYESLSDAQRYDLADAYMQVADRYASLKETKKASTFRKMVEKIYPGFGTGTRKSAPASPPSAPGADAQQTKAQKGQKAKAMSAVDQAGKAASLYYMNKLIREVFSEDVNGTMSSVGDILFLPSYDSGLKRREVQAGLKSIFDQYDFKSLNAEEVLDMDSAVVSPQEDGYWMVEIFPRAEYLDFFKNMGISSKTIGFYFRNFPQGWRLGAVGPVS